MSKLPHWMQACWHFFAFTGLAVWLEIFGRFLGQYA